MQHGFASLIVAESIGRNFCFNQNVTVGFGKGGKPVIGDNVRIYTGAVVAGRIRIGNNVTIAANSLVRKMFQTTVWFMGIHALLKVNKI